MDQARPCKCLQNKCYKFANFEKCSQYNPYCIDNLQHPHLRMSWSLQQGRAKLLSTSCIFQLDISRRHRLLNPNSLPVSKHKLLHNLPFLLPLPWKMRLLDFAYNFPTSLLFWFTVALSTTMAETNALSNLVVKVRISGQLYLICSADRGRQQ
jgi:hypothetical protein